MTVDGTWNLTIDTPMGERKSTLVLRSAGNTLEGSQSAEGQSADIFEGTVAGNDADGIIHRAELVGDRICVCA